MRRFALAASVALAGCNSGSPAPAPGATATTTASVTQAQAAPAAAASAAPAVAVPAAMPTATTTKDAAVLDSRDCRTVAQAYTNAIEHNDYAFAARAWADAAVNETRLKAVFGSYAVPHVDIGKVEQEGAAGSSYCTVTGKLTDVANPNVAPQTGEIVLRRVNDVPGATAQQLRWTIQSSTFVEKLARSAK
jgi:hypothetical protein